MYNRTNCYDTWIVVMTLFLFTRQNYTNVLIHFGEDSNSSGYGLTLDFLSLNTKNKVEFSSDKIYYFCNKKNRLKTKH